MAYSTYVESIFLMDCICSQVEAIRIIMIKFADGDDDDDHDAASCFFVGNFWMTLVELRMY